MKRIITLLTVLAIAHASFSQKGSISGQVTDQSNGETIIGATVLVKETGQGTTTDMEGRFSLKVKAGTYTIQTSYVSYARQIIEGVEVTAGEEENLHIPLKNNTDLEEIVVRADALNNNEVALISMQKKSLNVQDGISASEMERTGISNAAQAISRIPGTTVEEGKYVVIRGLGDRYSVTLMDGIILPGTDPNRNSASLDLIPAGMLDNVVIKKSYTPDMPGNFAGGVADISTRSIPAKAYFSASVSTGFNTNATFSADFQRDRVRSSTDWLGYDDGLRSLPQPLIEHREAIRGASASSLAIAGRTGGEGNKAREIINNTSRAFDTDFVPAGYSPMPDYSLDVSFGNRLNSGSGKLGYNFGIKHSRSFSSYTQGVLRSYETNTDGQGNFAPNLERDLSQSQSTDEASTGALASLSYQFDPNHRLTVKNIYSHIGGNTVNSYEGTWPGGISNPGAQFHSVGSAWQEKTFNFSVLSGKHFLESLGELQIRWSAAYNTNTQYEPDLRLYAFLEDEGRYSVKSSETQGDPKRLYRNLADDQITGKIDFTLPLEMSNGRKMKIQWGGYYSHKQRNFSEQFYEVAMTRKGFTNPSYLSVDEAAGNMQQFFDERNFGFIDDPESNGTGTYHGFGNIYKDASIAANQYSGNEVIAAGYVMGSYRLRSNFRVVGGVRIEHTNLHTVNEGADSIYRADPANPDKVVKIPSEGNVNKTDLLPTVNIIYNLTENTNIRAGYAQTIARPNMREISPFSSFGNIGTVIESGDPTLRRTLIRNYDLRLETYPNPGELLAFSAYYKNFQDPIILNIFSNGSVLEQKPVNVERAYVYGAEAEVRKSLEFLSQKLHHFSFAANVSLIYSKVDKTEDELERVDGNFTGAASVAQPWRPLQGQSPFIINAALHYDNPEMGWENALSFNFFGKRLAYQTPAQVPDVYEMPRPSLDLKSSKAIGDHLTVSISIQNILDMDYRSEFDFSVPGIDNAYQAYRLGRTFNLGISCTL